MTEYWYCTECNWIAEIPRATFPYDTYIEHCRRTGHATTGLKTLSYGEKMRTKDTIPDKA